MTATTGIPEIGILSATEDPAGYVDRLLEIADDHDPLTVLATTPVRVRDLCGDTPTELIETVPEPGE